MVGWCGLIRGVICGGMVWPDKRETTVHTLDFTRYNLLFFIQLNLST